MEAGVDGLLRDRTRPPGKAPIAAGPGRRDRSPDASSRRRTRRPTGRCARWRRSPASRPPRCRRSGRRHGLSPHRWRHFKLSNDPAFAEKLKDIVGLYVAPPAHAVVLSIDEKSQIQALDRTQPGLPMKKGRAGTMTHDYKRNGTTTLFAALNVLDGTVIGQNMQRHRHQEFIRFLNRSSARFRPARSSTRSWTTMPRTRSTRSAHGSTRHPRWTFHFTPTSCSWLNAVEGFFAKLTRRRLKHGVFHSVVDLQAAINRFVNEHNAETRSLHLARRSRRHHRSPKPRVPNVGINRLGRRRYIGGLWNMRGAAPQFRRAKCRVRSSPRTAG